MSVQSYHFIRPRPEETCGVCLEMLTGDVVDHGNGDRHPVHQKCAIAWKENTCAICRAEVDKSPIYSWTHRLVIKLKAVGLFLIDAAPSILGSLAAAVIAATLSTWGTIAIAFSLLLNGWSIMGTQLALPSVRAYHQIVVQNIRYSVEEAMAPIRARESLFYRIGRVVLSALKLIAYFLVQLYTFCMYGISPQIRLIYRLFPRMGEMGRLKVAQGMLGFSICLGIAPLFSLPLAAISGAAISFQVRHIEQADQFGAM